MSAPSTVLEEIIDDLTKRGAMGAMCAAAFKKHSPNQVQDHQHFPPSPLGPSGTS